MMLSALVGTSGQGGGVKGALVSPGQWMARSASITTFDVHRKNQNLCHKTLFIGSKYT